MGHKGPNGPEETRKVPVALYQHQSHNHAPAHRENSRARVLHRLMPSQFRKKETNSTLSEEGGGEEDEPLSRTEWRAWAGLLEGSSPLTPICSQIAAKSARFLNVDVWSKELLWALTKPDRTHQEQPPEKVGCAPPREQPCCPSTGCMPAERPGALERNRQA